MSIIQFYQPVEIKIIFRFFVMWNEADSRLTEGLYILSLDRTLREDTLRLLEIKDDNALHIAPLSIRNASGNVTIFNG